MRRAPASGGVDVSSDGVAAGVALRRRLSAVVVAGLHQSHGKARQEGWLLKHAETCYFMQVKRGIAATWVARGYRGVAWGPGRGRTLMIAFLAASAELHSRVHQEGTPSRPARPA